MNLQQLITKTEIIQALHVVESNQSFRSTDKDSERHTGKTRHIIAPFGKDFIIHDTKGKCFTYKFDETTTSKVGKQYDRYITNFSDFFKQVITAYSGSLLVGHCTSKYLLHHFYSFMESLDLSTS